MVRFQSVWYWLEYTALQWDIAPSCQVYIYESNRRYVHEEFASRPLPPSSSSASQNSPAIIRRYGCPKIPVHLPANTQPPITFPPRLLIPIFILLHPLHLLVVLNLTPSISSYFFCFSSCPFSHHNFLLPYHTPNLSQRPPPPGNPRNSAAPAPESTRLERAQVQWHAAAAAGAVLAGPAVEVPGFRQLSLVLKPPPTVLYDVSLASVGLPRTG